MAARTKVTVLVAAALVCAAVAVSYGSSPEAVELCLFAVIFAVAAGVDWDTRRIPNELVIAACFVRLAYIAATGFLGTADAAALLAQSLVGAVALGGGIAVATMVADRLFGGQNMGGGDIKLFAVVGLYFGFSNGLVVAMLACVLGAAFGLASSRPLRQNRELQEQSTFTFPFGPAIAVASIVVAIASSPLFDSLF